MTTRVVYDTMVFLQWAARPADSQHATVRAVFEGTVRLCVSRALLDEVRDVLSRPAVMARCPNFTPERLDQIVAATVELAEWVAYVPAAFSRPHHPDDDPVFNLAIAAKADRLVTWENRTLGMDENFPGDAGRLRAAAPPLRIVSPKELSDELRISRAATEPGPTGFVDGV